MSFINLSISIFSSYLTEENKIEIINNINDILKMCIFFKVTLDIPKDKFEITQIEGNLINEGVRGNVREPYTDDFWIEEDN